MKPTTLPALAQGMRVRLASNGPIYTVSRVTPCAAYLRGGEARTVILPDGRTFVASGSEVLAVSCKASVWREAEG